MDTKKVSGGKCTSGNSSRGISHLIPHDYMNMTFPLSHSPIENFMDSYDNSKNTIKYSPGFRKDVGPLFGLCLWTLNFKTFGSCFGFGFNLINDCTNSSNYFGVNNYPRIHYAQQKAMFVVFKSNIN